MHQQRKSLLGRVLSSLLLLAAPTALQAQYSYTTNADGFSITITGYTGPGGAVAIPTNINGPTVTNIGGGSFLGLDNMTSVTIPGSVTNIGTGAFAECYNLTSATIPGNVLGIGEHAFALCFSLTNVIIPAGVTTIGEEAFEMCGSLSTVSIPASVTNIGDLAFLSCALTNITILASVISIGANAFELFGPLPNFFFAGNAPTALSPVFPGNGAVYYLPGTIGWSNTYPGYPSVLWNPQMQTGDASFGVQSNQFGFNITGTPNIPIVVEACSNLASPVWTPLQTLTLTNGLCYFSEALQSNSSGRFYRISAP